MCMIVMLMVMMTPMLMVPITPLTVLAMDFTSSLCVLVICWTSWENSSCRLRYHIFYLLKEALNAIGSKAGDIFEASLRVIPPHYDQKSAFELYNVHFDKLTSWQNGRRVLTRVLCGCPNFWNATFAVQGVDPHVSLAFSGCSPNVRYQVGRVADGVGSNKLSVRRDSETLPVQLRGLDQRGHNTGYTESIGRSSLGL